MTPNKGTVQRYMDAFRTGDHALVLSCLTDDVEWVIPGAFHLRGKEAFDGEIENDAFVGRPTIELTRLVEEGDVVVPHAAKGEIIVLLRESDTHHALFMTNRCNSRCLMCSQPPTVTTSSRGCATDPCCTMTPPSA